MEVIKAVLLFYEFHITLLGQILRSDPFVHFLQCKKKDFFRNLCCNVMEIYSHNLYAGLPKKWGLELVTFN